MASDDTLPLAQRLAHIDEPILLADGFDAAFIGIAQRVGQPIVAIYDRARCVEILTQHMSPDEAEEFFAFNVEGAWVGPGTPLFLYKVD